MEEKKNHVKRWMSYFLLAVSIIIVYKFLDNFTQIGEFLTNLVGILMPFIIGILISYVLYIPCKKIEECFDKSKNKFLKKKSKGMAVFTTYLIAIIVLFILINVILPPIIASIYDLVSNLPSYYRVIMNEINKLPEDSILFKLNVGEVINQIASIDFAKYLSLENISNYIRGVISVASGIFDIFVTMIISIYTLAERKNILNFLKKATSSLFNKETYIIISKYFRKTNEIFFNFISGQVIDAILVGIITTIAMTIMKVKYATLLGFLIGLFNLIPFFGAIVAVCIAIIITVCTGGLGKAIWLAIVVIIIQQIDANVINPKIIGDKLKISPILIIFSVTFAGAYFGVLGMFLAVPIITILKLFVCDYLDYKIQQSK